MSFDLMLNPTITGGTTTTLAYVGEKALQQVYLWPNSTHLAPNELVLGNTKPVPSKQSPGIARSKVRTTKATRVATEGCCDVQIGDASIETNVRWYLNQPESVLDSVIAEHRAYINSAHFVVAIKQGLFPS